LQEVIPQADGLSIVDLDHLCMNAWSLPDILSRTREKAYNTLQCAGVKTSLSWSVYYRRIAEGLQEKFGELSLMKIYVVHCWRGNIQMQRTERIVLRARIWLRDVRLYDRMRSKRTWWRNKWRTSNLSSCPRLLSSVFFCQGWASERVNIYKGWQDIFRSSLRNGNSCARPLLISLHVRS
jgi:hypothetical protein